MSEVHPDILQAIKEGVKEGVLEAFRECLPFPQQILDIIYEAHKQK